MAASLMLDAARGARLWDASALLNLGDSTLGEIWSEIAAYAPVRECRQLSYSGMAHELPRADPIRLCVHGPLRGLR